MEKTASDLFKIFHINLLLTMYLNLHILLNTLKHTKYTVCNAFVFGKYV